MPRKPSIGKKKILEGVIALEKSKKNSKSHSKPNQGERYYTMLCFEGKYEARSWFGLGWAIFTHRLWHLWNHGRWMD
jgi:hypothetical protein